MTANPAHDRRLAASNALAATPRAVVELDVPVETLERLAALAGVGTVSPTTRLHFARVPFFGGELHLTAREPEPRPHAVVIDGRCIGCGEAVL